MLIHAYLRASTEKQDAERAIDLLKSFISSKNNRIASFYVENISGTTASRPELDRLLRNSESGDVLLIEKMDRLTRLPYGQWQTLKERINKTGLKIICADQPMTHGVLTNSPDELGTAIQQALTNFMLDLGAAMARDDYETRVNRQRQGIAKARTEGRYKGKQANTARYEKIIDLLDVGMSYSKIQSMLDCGSATISRARAWHKQQQTVI